MPNIPIDLASVDWLYVVILAVFALVATFIANLITFSHRGMAAILSAVLFAVFFVAWTYYPHGLPLPTRLAGQSPAPTSAPPPPPAAAAPEPPQQQQPRNPVRDITPPAAPR
ncbi:MAG TPA: hypothetical protein VGJ01_03735 [Pseudolabrys sp.]|jgi:hypothetical protein